jgi:hypothetical protein
MSRALFHFLSFWRKLGKIGYFVNIVATLSKEENIALVEIPLIQKAGCFCIVSYQMNVGD